MGSAAPDPTLQGIFETEVSEFMETTQAHLLRIEAGEHDWATRLPEMLRLTHDVKGSARVVGAAEVAHLAHALEARLLTWRDRKSVDSASVQPALDACDMLAALAADAGADADDEVRERVARARALAAALDPDVTAETASPPVRRVTSMPVPPSIPATAGQREARRADSVETLRVDRQRIDAVARLSSDGLVQLKLMEERYQNMRTALRALGRMRLPAEDDAPRALARIRDEMLATISQVCRSSLELGEVISDITSGIGELDYSAYDLCTVPCTPLVGHLERVARDAATALGRQVRLEVEGRDIQLDKAVVEKLKAPLTHAVRNAVDHGIEAPDERVTAGKDAVGVLRLVLREDHETLVVRLTDDGRGIDRAAVRARLGPEATDLDDRDLLARLLRCGLSTRDAATEISGRGIGLGSLVTLAHDLHGEVTLTSRPGHGTTVRMRLPLRLSLLEALVVESCGVSLVLPRSGVGRVESAGDDIPAPELGTFLGLAGEESGTHVVTLLGGDRQARFAVDGPGAQKDIVQRPVGAHLGRVPFASGLTVLPNGHPAWILDPRELVEACGETPGGSVAGKAPTRRILLVDDSRSLRKQLHDDLTRAGFDVVLANDGLTALDRIEAMTIDAVVSDVQMPRVDGFELLQRCPERLPVILISSVKGPDTKRRALALGAVAFLVKEPDLGSRVEAVLADMFSRNLEVNP
ncbi:MAG: response regulator [Planctomycetota bacterium]|jgi:chemotaxis protein histidine kinase CheA